METVKWKNDNFWVKLVFFCFNNIGCVAMVYAHKYIWVSADWNIP